MKRFELQGNTRFLTFSCFHRLALFKNPAIMQVFVDELTNSRRVTRFQLFGWVIMPEHVHLLLRPELPEFPLASVLNRLKLSHARRVIGRWRALNAPVLARITDGSGHLRFWQRGGGYDRNIRSVDDFYEKLRYIHRNPVDRGLAPRAIDWPWSSARAYCGGGEVLIPVDPYEG